MDHPTGRRHFFASLTVTACAVAGLLSGCNNIPDTVKIGVAQPLSGGLGALGQDMLNGVKLAVEDLNQEGFVIDGKKVTLEIVAVDDKADAGTGKLVAQQLVDAGVVAVIGHFNSGVSIEAAPIYASKNLPQIAISTNPKFTQLGFPGTFRMVANDTLQARAIGSFAASQLGASAYAVVDDGTPYGKGLADGAAEQLKEQKKDIPIRLSFDDKTTVFDDLANKIKAAKIGVVVSTLNDFQTVALVQALKKIDYTKVSILGGDTTKTTDMLKAANVVDGIYATSPILDAKEFLAGKAFLDKFQKVYKSQPAYGAHYSYDSMQVLAAAMKRAKSVDPKEITAALHAINGYAPVTGIMTWDEKGEQRYGAVGVYGMRGEAWELRMRSDRW